MKRTEVPMATTDDYCEKLKNELSFHFLSPADNQLLVKYLRCRKATTGETLWSESDACGEMAFIVTGHLEVRKQTEFPGKNVIVGVYGPGSIVGELCVLQGVPRSVSVSALNDCELLMMGPSEFDTLAAKSPDLAIKLLKGMLLTVSIRLNKSFERLATIF